MNKLLLATRRLLNDVRFVLKWHPERATPEQVEELTNIYLTLAKIKANLKKVK